MMFEPAPFQRHSSTSRAAAESMNKNGKAAAQRALVFQCLMEHGPQTDEEIHDRLGLDGDSERPRRVSLVDAGVVHDTGEKRATKSGRKATVWKVRNET